jgi:molybdopterin-containing oxidoreductase family iron-sulfur binding subunit
MKLSRRRFLGIATLAALAALGRKFLGSLSGIAQKTASFAGESAPPRRWAMVIDLRKCAKEKGCADCLAACDKAHNIPEFKSRAHEVRWIWTEKFADVFPEQASQYAEGVFNDLPIPVLCNHCDKPPCVRVCPTQATWKREDGIVMMDWHRCIGCRYCIAACPYGARSFNWLDPRPRIASLNLDFPTRTKGVVEKCNFCEERLAEGKLPACVEACSEEALVFGDLADPGSEIRRLLRTRYAIRRKAELGTGPAVFYLV